MSSLTTLTGWFASLGGWTPDPLTLARIAGGVLETALLLGTAWLILHLAGPRIPAKVRHASWLLVLGAGLVLPLVPRHEHALHLGLLPAIEATPTVGMLVDRTHADGAASREILTTSRPQVLEIGDGWVRAVPAPGAVAHLGRESFSRPSRARDLVDPHPGVVASGTVPMAGSPESHPGASNPAVATAPTSWLLDSHPGASETAVTPASPGRVAALLASARAGLSRVGSALAPLAPIALVVWALGALLILGRVALGTVAATRLARRGDVPDDPAWYCLLAEVRDELGIRRPVTLRLADVTTPMTWGAIRPTVLFPYAARDWDEERCRLVLLHELAHVRRNDWLAHLVGQVACAVHWFDPLAWIAARRLADAREDATDDAVLAAGARPSVYATHLLAIARTVPGPSAGHAVALTMTTRHPLESRLMSILDARPRTSRRAFLTPVLLGGLVLTLAMVEPWPDAPTSAEAAGPKGGRGHGTIVHALPSPPTPPTPPTPPSPGYLGSMGMGSFHVIGESEDGSVRVTGFLLGDIEFADEGGVIDWMDEDASLDVFAEVGDAELEAEILPDRDGAPEVLYLEIDGEEMSADDDRAKELLARALTVLADEMGDFRIYTVGGVSVVETARGGTVINPRGVGRVRGLDHLEALAEKAAVLADQSRLLGDHEHALGRSAQVLREKKHLLSQLDAELVSRLAERARKREVILDELVEIRDQVDRIEDELDAAAERGDDDRRVAMEQKLDDLHDELYELTDRLTDLEREQDLDERTRERERERELDRLRRDEERRRDEDRRDRDRR